MILKSKRIIFIHIPRTAGTSIDSLLFGRIFMQWNRNGYWEQHAPLKIIKQQVSLDDFFIFSSIRNPFDRFISSCFWLCREKKINPTIKNFKKIANLDFEWLNPEKLNKPSNRLHHLVSMTDYLSPIEKIDFVIRFENLQNDYSYVQKILKLTNLPHSNSTDRKFHYSKYYDKELKDQVREMYKNDLENFNYEFEHSVE